VSFLTGSLGDFLDRNYESEKVKTLFLANNVYGKHGGPYQPGTALGLLFHLLSGGEHDQQGFYGHVMGGMGSITNAMAKAARGFGAEIRTGSSVQQIDVRDGRVRAVVLEDGPKSERGWCCRTPTRSAPSGMVQERDLPDDFVRSIRGIKMEGPCAKVNMVLAEEPRFTGTPAGYDPQQRSLFTLVPSLEFAERCYDIAKFGEIPEQLWVDCVIATNADPSLAPAGKHVMTCFCAVCSLQTSPGQLGRESRTAGRPGGEEGRGVCAECAGRDYRPSGSYSARSGNAPTGSQRQHFHGDLTLEQLFFNRPVAGWSQYRTPIGGLYLCGAGAHPGGGVTGAPGHNSAHQVLRDLKKGKFREAVA